MASDEIVWQYINQNFCAFKIRTPNNQKQTNFCRNEYNVTGLCNRQSCPLANSRYASVRPHPDKPSVLYLYMKTVERAHLPNRMWEKIKLPSNYQKALAMIDEKLMYWPEFLKHKAKQRLTRLTQVAIRMRKIAAEEDRLGEKLVPKLAPKVKHREAARERKAEAAAKLERTIERELLERLRQGAYGDQPLNVSQKIWEKVLNGLEKEGQGVRDKDLDEGVEDEDDEDEFEKELEEEDDELEGNVEYVSDFEESEDDIADIEDWMASEEDDDDEDDAEEDDSEEDSEEEATAKKGAAKAGDKRKRGRVVRMKGRKKIEREIEEEPVREKLVVSDW
ncbi:ribosomal L28e protein family-domain-containing protein [Coniella lustricola]|uniref:Protein MAK16 n=1 Tax=Coniella lustricola TaxID=2025994 RepID=A0A2T2ZX65_9PEZI|nr:ribosomal L28e protein family-domain-containing protein [Coniella lustricola]